MSTPVPIRDLVEARRDGDTALEQPIRWKPATWSSEELRALKPEIHAAEDISERLEGGWRQIRRKHVVALSDDLGPRGVFAGAMIWGFGPIGYGASRTARMIAPYSRRDLANRLQKFATAAADGPESAWDVVVAKNTKIRGLGPAFGTKVTYFLARAEVEPVLPLPLIADLNTSWAIWDLCAVPRSAFGRSNYLLYVDIAHRWAEELRCPVDDVERALFEYGKGVPRN